jgi:alpha-1,6-mannosyltransferase
VFVLPAALGFAGSVLVALAAWRGGALPAIETWPTPVRISRQAVGVFWWTGQAVLTVAWFWLRVRARGRARAGVIVAIAVLWALPLLFVPPVGSRDTYSYAAHGELAARGLDPGEHSPLALPLGSAYQRSVSRVWRDVVSAYGPLSSGSARLATTLGGHEVAATVLWLRLWAVVGVALIGVGAFSVARWCRRDGVDALVLALCGPLTVVHLVAGAHNEAVMAGLMMVGLAVGLRARSVFAPLALTGAALVGLGAAVKLPAILAAAFLGWFVAGAGVVWWRRAVAAAVHLAVAVAAIEVVSLATGLGWGWVRGITAGSSVTTTLSMSTALGLGVSWLFGQPRRGTSFPAVADGVRTLVELASFVGASVLVWRSPRLGVRALGFALLLVGLLGPAVHPWYAVWGFVVLAATEAGRAAWWLTLGAAVVSALTKPAGGGALPNLGQSPVLSLTVFALAAAAAVIAYRRHRSFSATGSANTPYRGD